MAEELDAELVDIKEELALIEGQLSSLLERQHQLMKKKRHLEDSLRLTADAGAHESAAVQWDKEVFPWSKNLVKARNSVFKLDSFRPLQLQTMNATLSGKDVILIMPTGAGKSLCFQLPAIVSQGVTLVVSPLVSLMEDQTMSLRNVDGITAQMLCASTPKEDVKLIQDDMTSSKSTMNLLYVTPEKLAKSKRFMSKLEKMYSMGRLARLVIDEVHCCSQWGHDFRPDYKFLGIMKRQFPKTPILGLTATATTNVLEDVKKILQIPRCLILKASFNRANLFYEVHAKPSSSKEMVDTLVTAITTRFTQQSGIIYCLSQKDSEDVASKLKSCGIESGCYHANLSPSYRSRIHKDWISGVVQVVVATTAFGMGIDKPDVRFVIHHSISKSMENYYQESGRAGRDDKPAHCILYCGFGDVFRLSTMVMSEQTGIDNLYAMLRYAYNTSRCRRSLIAQFFNAKWDSSDCAKMCDHCQTQGESVKKDLSSYGRDLSAILAQAQSRKLQVTALKLLDAWMGRGGVPLRVDGVKPPADKSRAHAERVIVHLLVLGYLKEEYHFTPYSTISYLVQGPKSTMLQNPNHTILVDWPSTSQSKTGKPTSRKPKSSVQLPKPKSRPKKVSSAATNPVFFSEEDFDEGMEDGGSRIQNGHTSYEDKSSEPHPKKRRTHLVVSDSDSDWDVSELEPVLSEVQRKSTAVAKGDIKVIELT